MNDMMEIGSFIIMMVGRNEDRTQFYHDFFFAPLHITDLKQAWKFGQEAALVRWEHLPGVVPEKLVVKKLSEAQL